MTVPSRILIDTNIIINLEDHKEIGKHYADLTRICGQYGITLFAHEAAQDDVARDRDADRRRVSLSKLEKYSKIHRTPTDKADKERRFGAIRKPNDEVDTDLLVSLDLNTADLLVTDDLDLIGRVKGTPLSDRVLTLQDTNALLQEIFGVVSADFKHVQDKACNQFNPDDPFFISLAADYPDFHRWYRGCMASQRPCWIIMQQAGIGGMIIYKPEFRHATGDRAELDQMGVPGDKVLKMSLFKVDPSSRGEKFGEQLLKKAMDHAYRNDFDTVYVTVFPRHEQLIELLNKFGFQKCGTKGTGAATEDVYYKHSKVVTLTPQPEGIDFHRKFWPCINLGGAEKYLVPIQPDFHDRLFPEAAARYAPLQMQLFEDALPQTPGNAIRKAYVCNAPTRSIPTGSIMLFYRSVDGAITSVGVLETYSPANGLVELKGLVGNRSVYTDQELASKVDGPVPAKAMNFYYAKDLKNPITLAALRRMGLSQPQSIVQLHDAKFRQIFDVFDPEDKELFHD
jgi:ribosomal protein S18 acetylase RimI-like enzyme